MVTKASRTPAAVTRAAPETHRRDLIARRPSPAITPAHVVDGPGVVALGHAAGNEAVTAYLRGDLRPVPTVQRAGEPEPRKERIASVRMLGGGAMNLGVFEVTGESGSYIVKMALPSAGVHRAVFADRVFRRFGVEDTGSRAETGRRAYALVGEMLAAPRIDGPTRAKLEEARSRHNLRAVVMNRKVGAAWQEGEEGARPRATDATHAQLMNPHTMEELGRIFAIDTLLGNFDRIRHSTGLRTTEAADRFDPLALALHPDNMLTTATGLAPIDQDTALPGPSAMESHYEAGQGQNPRLSAARSLSSSPEAYATHAVDRPAHAYSSPSGGQQNLEPRYGHMRLSHLVNDRYLDQVATEIVRETPGVDVERSCEAFRRGVTGIVTRLGDRATRRELVHTLDEVYRDANPDERVLLDKGTLRMRMKFLGAMGRRRAEVQGGSPEALTALDTAAAQEMTAVTGSIGTERWLHAPESSDSGDKLARWAPAVLEISNRRLDKATRLMDGRLVDPDRPFEARRDSMQRHVLSLMNRTHRELSKPTLADSPHRAPLERALVNFGRAAEMLGTARAGAAGRRTGDAAAEAPGLRGSWRNRPGSGGGWFKRLVPALGLAAAAGLGTAAALSSSFRGTLTGSVGSIPGIGNMGPLGAWIGGGIALLGLAGFAAGRYFQRRAKAKHAVATDPHSPRAVARGASLSLHPAEGAVGGGIGTGGPLTLLPERREKRGPDFYVVCTVVSGVAPPEKKRVRESVFQGLTAVNPADANPPIPRDYRRPGEVVPLVEEEVARDDAMRRYRELAAQQAAAQHAPGAPAGPPLGPGAAPRPQPPGVVEEAGRAEVGARPGDLGPRGPGPEADMAPEEDERSLAHVLRPPGAAVDLEQPV